MRERTLTIGLPVYNGERYIREALTSLLSQKFQDFSVIVGDNASTDHTREIVEDFIKADDRVTLSPSPRNMGPVYNFQRLLHLAPAQGFFAWLAADDAYCDTFLGSVLREFDDDATVGAMSDVQQVNEAGEVILMTELTGTRRLDHWRSGRKLFFAWDVGFKMCFFIYGVFRSEVLKRAPPLPVSTKKSRVLGLEYPYLARLATMGRLVSVPEPLFRYRRHGNSVSSAEWKAMSRSESHLSNLVCTGAKVDVALRSSLPAGERLAMAATAVASTGQIYMNRLKRRVGGRA